MPPTAAATAPPASSSRSTTATRAPSAAKRSHMARPMPLAPPVTTATRSDQAAGVAGSVSLMSLLSCVLQCGRAAGRAVYSELMKTFFTSLNASSASGPSSRPIPDCFAPPKGVQ